MLEFINESIYEEKEVIDMTRAGKLIELWVGKKKRKLSIDLNPMIIDVGIISDFIFELRCCFNIFVLTTEANGEISNR